MKLALFLSVFLVLFTTQIHLTSMKQNNKPYNLNSFRLTTKRAKIYVFSRCRYARNCSRSEQREFLKSRASFKGTCSFPSFKILELFFGIEHLKFLFERLRNTFIHILEFNWKKYIRKQYIYITLRK